MLACWSSGRTLCLCQSNISTSTSQLVQPLPMHRGVGWRCPSRKRKVERGFWPAYRVLTDWSAGAIGAERKLTSLAARQFNLSWLDTGSPRLWRQPRPLGVFKNSNGAGSHCSVNFQADLRILLKLSTSIYKIRLSSPVLCQKCDISNYFSIRILFFITQRKFHLIDF